MSYCLNPNCSKPYNPDTHKFCQNCGSQLLLGERYRAIRSIGQGGFGRTFVAIDEYKPSKPRCAIKQLHYSGKGADIAEKLFEQEAERLDELGKHPQIPELLAHFSQEHYNYLVQEFIDGKNLADELEDEGAFDEDKIVNILKDLLPVLEFIHDRKIIHRDIKPENIIRNTLDNKLTLVDFGIAKQISTCILSKTATIIGTPDYSAPEQIVGKPQFSSDIYSLGVTCIHLLTELSPFQLESSSEPIWVWRNYLSSAVSDDLATILDRMIDKNVAQRYSTAESIIKDLTLINAKNEFIKGQKKGQQAKYVEAIDKFTQAIGTNACYAEAFYCRGLAYSRIRRDKSALQDFEKAADLYQQQNQQDRFQEAQSKIRESNSIKYILQSLCGNNQRIIAKQIFNEKEVEKMNDIKVSKAIYKFLKEWTKKEKKNVPNHDIDWGIIFLWRNYLENIVNKSQVPEKIEQEKESLLKDMRDIRNNAILAETLKNVSQSVILLFYDALKENEKDKLWEQVEKELRAKNFAIGKEKLKNAGLKNIFMGSVGLPGLLIPIIAQILLQKMTQGILAWILINILGQQAFKRAALGFLAGPAGFVIGGGLAVISIGFGVASYNYEKDKAKFVQAILSIYFFASVSNPSIDC
jgi:serine/threonine protein kinase